MDSALFVPSVPQTGWLGTVLPGLSPAELPIAGRRYIDYAIEAAQRFDVVMAEVLDWHWTERMQREFDELTRSTIPIFYQKGAGYPPCGLRDLQGQSSPLTADMQEGLVVIWGITLPHHSLADARLEPLSDAEVAETPVGVYRYTRDGWMRIVPNGFVVKNVQTWFGLNMILARDNYGFTLPGYSAEPGVHLGSNVTLEHGTEAKTPLIVGDNVWCARNVALEGEVIIGNGAVVGEGARLRRTIVFDNTFVGQGLELQNKIVRGNRIIDCVTGAWVDVEDAGVARWISDTSFGWLGQIWHFLAGTSRGRRD